MMQGIGSGFLSQHMTSEHSRNQQKLERFSALLLTPALKDTIADFFDFPLKMTVFHPRGIHAEPRGKQCLFLWRPREHRGISAIFSKSPLVYDHSNIFSSSNHISVLSKQAYRHPCSFRSSFLKCHNSFKIVFTFVWFSLFILFYVILIYMCVVIGTVADRSCKHKDTDLQVWYSESM